MATRLSNISYKIIQKMKKLNKYKKSIMYFNTFTLIRNFVWEIIHETQANTVKLKCEKNHNFNIVHFNFFYFLFYIIYI